ncbi:MAG TPA: choice-of-anchor tandem repeat GloVer-containing protein [Rhizomicrobium sp.]|jgi:uncharacterized repeat protein (TIGR03803 family)|nr:choice-of-anchor tandem repeat GloVer-containing protein [Rhizomicrobium sp.]
MLLNFLHESVTSAPVSRMALSHARRMRAMAGTALIACAWGCVVAPAADASSEQVVWSFGNGTDGAFPYAGLINGGAGTLYGTTSGGGVYGAGTLFSLNLGTNAETVSWSFGNGADDGQDPYATPIAVKGTLYGTTTAGGTLGSGTVFSFDQASGAETVLHSFDISDGQEPFYLMKAGDRIYGTTLWGGGYGQGNQNGDVYVYSLRTGATKVLYAFGGGTDSANPVGALLDVNGKFYGAASAGGIYGRGTVYAFNPKTHAETLLWSFGNGADGQTPNAGLIDVYGTLYGTTTAGGAYGYGTVFSLNLQTGAETVLWSFGNGTDGQDPNKNLTYVNGTLYGTTEFGGAYGDSGTVYAFNLATNAETVLWSFGSGSDGQYPSSSLLYLQGTLYGTTIYGGANGKGTVFSIVP